MASTFRFLRFAIAVVATLVFISGQGYGQRLTVTDKANLQPLAGVRVVATLSGNAYFTDAKGQVLLENLRANDSLRFERPDYQTRTVPVSQLAFLQYKVLLAERSFFLNEVVVSASKFEEKRADVPQQITVLKARDLAFQNNQTSADVLQQSGQVLVQKSQAGGGSPIMRGFEANKVLMVVDGVRLNNAIYRGGHLQNVITIDNATLDKVEVVFGPGSVVYGSDALGGVIHFYTKSPVLSDSVGTISRFLNAYTRYATANQEKTGHVDFSVGGTQWGSFTSFTVSDFEDLRQGAVRRPVYGNLGLRPFYVVRENGQDRAEPNPNQNLQKFSGYRQSDLMQKVLYQPSAGTSHLLNVQYSTSSDIPRYDRLTETDNQGRLRHAQWYYGPQNRLMAAYTFARQGHGWLENLRVTAAYQHIEESRHNRRLNQPFLQNRLEQVGVYTLNIDASRLLRTHELRYGLEGTYNAVQSTAFSRHLETGATQSLDTRYPDGGAAMQSLAGYITHSWEISPVWILSNGLRLSQVGLQAQFNDKTFFPFPFQEVTQQNTALNGNVGLVYQPGRAWRFAAVASSGFRAPNVDDLGKVFDSVVGQLVVPNPDLRPEYTYNGEVTVGKSIAEKIRLEGTGFYTLYRNAITTQPFLFQDQTVIEYNGRRCRSAQR